MKNLIMWLKTNPLIYGGCSGRYKSKDELTKEDIPCFGFYWWFWKPELSHNKGRADKLEVVDTNIMWLCFWISITAWPLPIIDPAYLNMSDEQFMKVNNNG